MNHGLSFSLHFFCDYASTYYMALQIEIFTHDWIAVSFTFLHYYCMCIMVDHNASCIVRVSVQSHKKGSGSILAFDALYDGSLVMNCVIAKK